MTSVVENALYEFGFTLLAKDKTAKRAFLKPADAGMGMDGCCAGPRRALQGGMRQPPMNDQLAKNLYDTVREVEETPSTLPNQFSKWFEVADSCTNQGEEDAMVQYCFATACQELSKVCINMQKDLETKKGIRNNMFFAAWGVQFALQALYSYHGTLSKIEGEGEDKAKEAKVLKGVLTKERPKYELKKGKAKEISHLYGRGAETPALDVFLKRRLCNTLYQLYRSAGMSNLIHYFEQQGNEPYRWALPKVGGGTSGSVGNKTFADAMKSHYESHKDCLTKKTKKKFESEEFKASINAFEQVIESNGTKALARTNPGSGFWEEFNFHVSETKPSEDLLSDILTTPPPSKGKACVIV